MRNLITFAAGNTLFNEQFNMAVTHEQPDSSTIDTILQLRQRAVTLVEQADDAELLAEVIGMLSGASIPCAYTHEQMELSLREAEDDFQHGRYLSHSSICERYDSLNSLVKKGFY